MPPISRRLLAPTLPLVPLLLALTAAPARAQTAAEANPDQIARALGEAKTVFTHFVQERRLSLFAEPLRSEGLLCFEQPGRIRWEVTQPYRSILLSDGAGVAQFEWVDERWKKLDLGLAGAMQNIVNQIAGVMKGQYARPGGEHDVRVDRTPEGPLVRLTPRNEKMRKMIEAIEVQLAPDLKATRRVVLREKGGDSTTISFDEQKVNLRFPQGTFDRKSPLDMDQVRRRLEPAS